MGFRIPGTKYSAMADNSNEYRIKSSTKNATAAVVTQILMGVLSFAERMVFNQYFIADYLGFYSLFQNVISVLSVANIGISTAISYALYAPLAKDDFKEVNAILSFLKKIYRYIGLFILVGGLIFSIFIQYFVRTEVPLNNIRLYFYFYLLSTVFEYWFFYKTILFAANQKEYVNTIATNISWAMMYCFQMAISVFTRSFALYAMLNLVFSLVRCLIVNIIARKSYPYLREKPEKLSKESRSKILSNVKGLVFTRIGNAISDSSNSMLISALVGSSTLGMYANYQMFTSGMKRFLNIIPSSITASLGNIGATESSDSVAETYHYVDICYYIVYGSVTIVLFNIIDACISIFFGADRVMEISSSFLICLMLYISINKNLFGAYKSSLGLYWFDRYRPIITGVTDLVTSWILGLYMGFDGVILGTIIAYTIIDLWVEPLIIFHKGFNRSSRRYIAKTMFRLVFISAMMLATKYICMMLPYTGILNLILTFVVSTAITVAVFFIAYHRNKYLRTALKSLYHYMRRRNA